MGADVYSYANSYLLGAALQAVAVPFLLLSGRERSPSDGMVGSPEPEPEPAPGAATSWLSVRRPT